MKKNFTFLFLVWSPHILTVAISFQEMRPMVLLNFSEFSRKQLWFLIPVMTADDIVDNIWCISDEKINIAISNIKIHQIIAISSILERKINVLIQINENIIKDFKNLEEKINLIYLELNKGNYNISADIFQIQKINRKLLLEKKLYKNFLMIHKRLHSFVKCSIYHYKYNDLNNSTELLFLKINNIQNKIDTGDGINGLINIWYRLRSKNSSPKNNFLDNETCCNYDKIWNIYNNVKETFIEIFESSDKIEETDATWEDIIRLKLFKKEDYEENGIDTIDKLKNFLSENIDT